MCGFGPKAQRQSEGSNIKFYYASKYSGELLSLSIIRGQTATVSRHITCSASKWGRGQYSAVKKGSTANVPRTRLDSLDRTMNTYTWRPAPFQHTGVDTKLNNTTMTKQTLRQT